LSGPADLAAAIPHLLGFHPRESFVLVWLFQGRIVLTQRIDATALNDVLSNPMLLAESALRVDATEVFVTYFPSDPDVESAGLRDVAAAISSMGVSVLDALLIGRDWWRSVLCPEDCCSQGPRDLDTDVLDRVAADFVLNGVAVLSDREQLITEVAPEPSLAAQAANQWIRDPDYPALVAECVAGWQSMEPGTRMHMREAVVHLVALEHVAARDALIWYLAQLDSAALRYVGDLLRAVLRAAPKGHIAPIATLAGIAAWLSGDGARALIALDRGLADDPHYRLALMLQAALGAGLPPAQWRHVMLQAPGEGICEATFRGNPL
jgi:hypothetical protein